MAAVRYLDLIVLAIALPIFLARRLADARLRRRRGRLARPARDPALDQRAGRSRPSVTATSRRSPAT